MKDWEVVCDKCSGTGKEKSKPFGETCHKCWGEGKLDWVENMIGERQKFTYLVKPGIYVMEVDFSDFVLNFGNEKCVIV